MRTEKQRSDRKMSRLAGSGRRGGFTLVELVVVIVILLILTGGIVIGVMKWINWSNFKRQNEYAQTIFVAAQNQLTEYSANGQLPSLQAALSDGGDAYRNTLDVTALKDSDGNSYQMSEVWPESSKDTTRPNASRYQGTICSLIGTSEDYQAYLEGTAGEDATLLYDLLSSYLYDVSILNATVCLEFTPEDGQVFAVLYSDISTGFEYNSGNTGTKGKVDISNRETEYRKDRMVGYYGVDTLSRATSTRTEKPSISEVKLNNGDTLNLSFKLNKVKAATQELTYEVIVYAKGSKTPLLVLTVDGTHLKNELFKSEVSCGVTRYNYDENMKNPRAQKLGNYDIPAWVEQDGTIRLILDAADLGATSSLYYDAYTALMDDSEDISREEGLSLDLRMLRSTYSFRRFGVRTEDIYCTVQGSGTYYKTTAKKQSNVENTYFGSAHISTAGGQSAAVYAVENGRHLYNVRYMEDYTDDQRSQKGYEGLKTSDQITYQLTANVDWKAFSESGSLYETNEYYETHPAADNNFPSIRQLRSCAVFEGNAKERVISGLSVTESANKKAGLYGEKSTGATGVFLENKGTLREFSLDCIQVAGTEKTGAFCGVNSGKLEGLQTLSSKPDESPSIVTGTLDVGGITGAQSGEEEGDEVVYESLVNRASVIGNTYVGGIIGRMETLEDKEFQIKACKNYGRVEAVRGSSDAPDSGRYIGGIAGYCKNTSGETSRVEIRDCVSSPQYTDAELKAWLAEPEGLEPKLNGVYVGGIVGYNDGASVAVCRTENEEGKSGYVFGYQYVGGIAGFSEGTEEGIDGTLSGGKSGVNEAHVIGNSYVGGIVGCSAAVGGTDQNGIVIPDQRADYTLQVNRWINKGMVAATGSYAGGITGYNTGRIFGCSSDVDRSGIMAELADLAAGGNYAGGIAGYNNGSLGNTPRNSSGIRESGSKGILSAVCYVNGGSYAGGIVGYNDVNAVVEDYEVAGGYIRSSGSYVGGYAGFNASLAFFMDEDTRERSLHSNPNEVKGRYCVGGTIGGNVIAVGGTDISADFKTDNFLGKLSADAFAGGFIGYNCIVSGGTGREAIHAAADANIQAFAAAGLEEAAGLLADHRLAGGDGCLVIHGRESSSGTHTKLGEITARIYAGGVVGYNDENTALHIQDVTNLTPVTATNSIVNEKEQPGRLTYTGESFRYSYAGGMIGKVGRKVTLENCRNQDVGDVVSSGTYEGGLCEVNEGTIFNCAVSSIGSGNSDYVGGISGVNKADGVIKQSSFEKVTVTGRNYVGGITAENFGSIQNISMKNSIVHAQGTVGNAGGIAGYNYSGAHLTLSEDIQGIIAGSGQNIGGVAGTTEENLGLSENVNQVTFNGTVTGTGNVGGIAGNSQAQEVAGFCNKAIIYAEDGDAGGIIGIDSSQNGEILNCENHGSVSAARSGNAGGIIGVNQGTVSRCTDYGSVSAANGISGGIAGVNGGNVRECAVQAEKETLSFMGRDFAGGISGVNNGIIQDSTAVGIQITNPSGSVGGALGGIAGINTGTLSGCQAGGPGKELSLVSNGTDVSLGGMAGSNSGSISGTAAEYSRVYATLAFVQTNMSYYGNLGGIAGKNEGSISYCEFNGSVEGTANNPQNAPEYNPNTDFETNGSVIYGYGGIVGINGDSEAPSMAAVTDCLVNAARITGMGDPNNVANIGGAAGVNGQGASLRGITFGTGEKTYSPFKKNSSKLDEIKKASACVYIGTENNTAAYAHTGGIAGLNSGTIEDIGYDHAGNTWSAGWDETSLIIENYRGHVGGIAGYNRKTGRISCAVTGRGWVVFAPQNAQDNGCGGIIGYSASENDTSYCINRATVEKTVSSSNGVGGIVGRLECATGSAWQISNCQNYGKIRGTARVGGMVGIWKYYGGTISDCQNYGEIYTDDTAGSAGITGMLYDIRSTPARMVRCENHGLIRGKHVGGIVGGSYGGSSVYLQIEDCVNTGLIQAGGQSAGIAGEISKFSAGSYIRSCRNYGYGMNGESISGITVNSENNLTVSKCFGIADTDYPISGKAGDESNYYLSDDASGSTVVYYDKDGKETDLEPDGFYVRKIEAAGIQKPEYLKKIVWDTKGLNDGDRAYFSNSQSGTVSMSYIFTFNTAIDLSGMDLYWNRGTDYRVTDYTVYYSPYTEGGSWTAASSMSNASTGNFAADSQEVISLEKTVKARRIRIEVTKSIRRGGAGTNACLIRAHFRGQVLGIDYDGNLGYLSADGGSLSYGKYDGAGSSLTGSNSGTVCTYRGMAYESCKYSASSGKDKGRGMAARVERMGSGGGYRLAAGSESDQITIGLPGFSINPRTAFASGDITSGKLAALGDGEDNIRYQVFMADDPYFNVDAHESVTSLGTPAGIVMKDAGGAVYQAEWGSVAGAGFYEYQAAYYGADGTKLAEKQDRVYTTQAQLPVTAIGGQAVKQIIFQVRAGVSTLDEGGRLTEVWSPYSAPADQAVLDVLPTPQYHLELVRDNDTLKYQAFLDNQEEYRTFLASCGAADTEAVLESIMISIKAGNKDMSFNAKSGKSAAYFDGSESNCLFSAEAVHSGGSYTGSVRQLRESMAPVSSSYKSADVNFAQVSLKPDAGNGIGFRGITSDTLSYQLKIKFTKYVLYMRSELTALDKELGVRVMLSSSSLRTSDTTTDTVATSLSSLPAQLLDDSVYADLMVRSYPAMMSNNIVYTGHAVDISGLKSEAGAKGLSGEELKELYVSADGTLTREPTAERLIHNGTLADGYVIELASDGSYTIYYNALLEYNGYKNYDYSESGQSKQTQVIYYRLAEEKKLVKAPQIHINDHAGNGTDGDPNEDLLKITWDLEKQGYENEDGSYNYQKGAVYDYLLTGYTADGTAVQAGSGTYVTGTDGDNELSYDISAWNYKRVTISISRRGEAGQNDMTLVFPAGSVKVCELKLRFSQIAKPVVSLHRNEAGIVEKNSLIYDITWDGIPEGERSELSAYQVLVNRSDADTVAEAEYADQASFEAALQKLRTLYGSKPGVELEETPDQAVYRWQEEADGNSVLKTMTIRWEASAEAGNWKLVRNLEEIWEFPASGEAGDVMTRMLDLNDYARGEMIDISVRAIAADQAAVYRDGPEGVVRTMTLPSRLDVPDVEELTGSPSYYLHDETTAGQEETYVTQESLAADGILLQYTPSGESGVLQGKYELAAAVFENREEPSSEKVSCGGDGDGTLQGCWDDGALVTLVSKADSAAMSGNFLSAEYSLRGISADYAGKWLKIAMRSVSDSNVSSLWSDEDETEEGTVNYRWIQIPRVQTETPEFAEETKTLYYRDGQWNGDYFQTGAGTDDLPVIQTALRFAEQLYADNYRIRLVRSAVIAEGLNLPEQYTVSDADWIYLEKTGSGSYRVYYDSSYEGFHPEEWQNASVPACSMDDLAVFLGDIGPGASSYVVLPYTGTADESAADDTAKVNTVSVLQWEDGGFRLVLPDAESVSESGYYDPVFLFTASVSVRSEVTDENLLRYEYSEIENWYRSRNSSGTIETGTTRQEEYAGAPAVSLWLETSGQVQTAYEVKALSNHWLVWEVAVTDGAGGIYTRRRLGAAGTGTSDITSVLSLSDEEYALWQGHVLEVRAASIEIGNGGISQWTDWISLGTLPELVLRAPVVNSTQTNEAVGVLQAAGGGEQALPGLSGRRYSWTADPKASGYHLWFGSQEASVARIPGVYELGILTAENIAGGEISLLTVSVTLTVTQTAEGLKYELTMPAEEISVGESENVKIFRFTDGVKVQTLPENGLYHGDIYDSVAG